MPEKWSESLNNLQNERYALSPIAVADLDQIWSYIANDNETAADRVRSEFYEKFESLARMPGQGHPRPDYTKRSLLFAPLYSYLIAYSPNTKPLQIIAIVHGGRNVKRILRSRNV